MSSEQRAEEPREPARQSILWALASTLAVATWIAWTTSWTWALAAVFGLLVHEYGHYLAINRAGLGPSRIYMIPFFGGVATMPKPPPTDMVGVVIALAGPALGMVAALPFFVIHAVTGDTGWLEGAFVITVLNLFNLFPAAPLDGSKALGPVLAKVHPKFERAVGGGLGALAVIWLIQQGSFLVAGVVALALLPILSGRAMRPDAAPLDDGETGLAVALYLGVLALCIMALATISLAFGIANPFVLLTRLVGG
jgi:Zn-dependent protease